MGVVPLCAWHLKVRADRGVEAIYTVVASEKDLVLAHLVAALEVGALRCNYRPLRTLCFSGKCLHKVSLRA